MNRFVIAREDPVNGKYGIYHKKDVEYKKWGNRQIPTPRVGATPVCGNLSHKDGLAQHLKVIEERYGW